LGALASFASRKSGLTTPPRKKSMGGGYRAMTIKGNQLGRSSKGWESPGGGRARNCKKIEAEQMKAL